MWVKRILTTMQISQFVFGASYAAAHLFVKYDIPIQTAYTVMHPIASLASTATSTVSELTSSATSIAESPIASYGALLRRILLRAAGDEGVAENVRDKQTGQLIMPGVQEAIEEAVQRYREETRYSTDYHTINCIDTTGQSFAIWLNLIYLAPLTALFIRFFIRAYTHRTSSATPKQTKRHAADRSRIEAAEGVDRKVEDVGKAVERKLSHGVESMDEAVRKDLKQVKEGNYNKSPRRVSERVDSFERKVKTQAEQAKDKINEAMTPEKKSADKQEAADTLDELKQNVKQESGVESSQKTGESAPGDADLSKSKESVNNSTSSLAPEGDDEEEEAKTENEMSTPSKKKRKNKKKKHHNGGGENENKDLGSSSIVVVAAEQAKEQAEASKMD